MERQRKQGGESDNGVRVAQAKFTSKSRESEQERQLANSPAMAAQRMKLQSLFGGAVQRQGMEDEPLQGKFDAVQRVEEEEPLQGKFDTAQRVEEEEPLQGKFETAQRVEEEEPLQGRFEAVQRVEEDEPLLGKFEAASTAQLQEEAAKPNNTGLPDNLRNGIESLSGMSMDNVKVHYNSSQPAQLNALAYAQGTDIHVAPGQEQHLPHEAWHVVQQAQGRVTPTMQMKDGVPVNDDAGLEREADVMGKLALDVGRTPEPGNQHEKTDVSQLTPFPSTVLPYQFTTQIEYGGLTSFKFVRPDQQQTYTGNVGTAMSAHLDPGDAKTGTDTGSSNAFDSLFAALQKYTDSTWVRGHLLNHDLGGIALYNNLFPLTTAANGEHYQEVEKQVKYWVSKGWEVNYQVKAEQINEDGRGKFICYAKPTTGSETNQVLNKTIYSMPYKVKSNRLYSEKDNTEVNKFSAVVNSPENTVSRDQYKGKYSAHPKWKHKGGNATENNREITSLLDSTTLSGLVEAENLPDEEQIIIGSVNVLAELIINFFKRSPDDIELLEDIVTGHEPGNDFGNWLSVYKKEAGIT